MRTNLYILFIFLLLVGCNSDQEKVKINSQFAAYISAYTTGVISKTSTIRIRLTKPPISVNEENLIDLFKFSPNIDGQVVWVDKQTIEFVPNENLASSQIYTCDFDLEKVLFVNDGMEEFTFQFQTIQPNVMVYIDGFQAYDNTNLKNQKLTGLIKSSDVIRAEEVKKMITVIQENRKLPIHVDAKSETEYTLIVDSIIRGKEPSEVEIKWDGSVIDAEISDSKFVEVPSIDAFKVTQVKVVQAPEQYLKIYFSDPLEPAQNLNGLITVENTNDLSFVIERNEVNVYFKSRLAGRKLIEVGEGIKNIKGYKTPSVYSATHTFEQINPKLRLVGNGMILPNSNELIFPFEAVSLKYVDVFITRIFESNIVQFFQNNNYDGSNSLERLGREVYKGKVNLANFGKQDLLQWNRFYLDISDIINVEPGAIYNVELRFKKDYSMYQCDDSEESDDTEEIVVETKTSWNQFYSYNYGYWEYDYNWNERENPCHTAYYREYNCSASRNIYATDLGFVVKTGEDHVASALVTNMVTAKPESGVMVEYYDYQQQLISSVSTDANGMVDVKLSRRPFVAMAKYGDQKSYLKLDDGNSLSVSKFQVSGNYTISGLKGFIYGERGVWRPGDSLYLSFILEDKEQMLPEKHPLIFELTNPDGQLIQREVKYKAINQFYDLRTATSPSDITGFYRAKVKVGGATFSQSLRVETVKPNRLKIYFDFGSDVIYSSQQPEGDMNVKWLHGAIAKNLKAKVELSLSSIHTSFKEFTNYIFDDPTKKYSTESKVIFDEKVDQNGNASIPINITNSEASPGMIKAQFNTKVFEPGGDFSVDRYSVKISPFTDYVGIDVPEGTLWGNTLVTDEDHEIDIVSLTEEGELNGQREIEVSIYKLEWRWWWDSHYENIGSFISRSDKHPIYKRKIKTENGKGSFKFNIRQPNYGRYLIYAKDVKSGHTTGKIVYVDWPYYARENRIDNQNASMLAFSTDKEEYIVGEIVKITLPTSEKSKLYLTIENGKKVVEKHLIETSAGETKFEFEVKPNMAPNVYVSAMLIQPHANTVNDHPIRLFGIVPINVLDENTTLTPMIKTAEAYRPETIQTIKVTEKDGKPMTYTLAIVDEGLLDLTRYKTPNPWNYFYAKEALGVKTWDFYDYIIGAYSGELDQMLAIGGDMEGGGENNKKANRFKPMVRFVGPFELETGEENSHEIKIPNYIGSVKAMVVAGEDFAYGSAEQVIPVRKPLMVLSTLPRVITPGETVNMPVNIFAMENDLKNVKIKLTVSDNIKTFIKNMIIDKVEMGDTVVNFEMKVKEKIGIGKVKVEVSSGSEIAYDETEIDIRLPNPYVSNLFDTILETGQSLNSIVEYFGIEGTNEFALEVSTFPSLGIENRLNYLINYPHGCAEQVTSAAFPQLFLSKFIDLSSERKAEISDNVSQSLSRLVDYQKPSGGFSYWTRWTHSNDWVSSYIGHFLIEAEKTGYLLPIGMKRNWLKYQQQTARSFGGINDNSNKYKQIAQAYRLYTLALAGKPEFGAMNRLKEANTLISAAKWMLALAYGQIGQKEAAEKLIRNVSSTEEYYGYRYTYGSELRDKAIKMQTYHAIGNKGKSAELLKDISNEMSSKKWLSTQTTAYCLVAASQFLGYQDKNTELLYLQTLNGKTETFTTHDLIKTYSYKSEELNSKELLLTNKGGGQLFVRTITAGVPLQDNREEDFKNISIDVSYYNTDNTVLNPTKINQGTDFYTVVSIKNLGAKGQIQDLALEQMFPSGWEIINSRMEGIEDENKSKVYQDIRDDRVYSYFNLNSYETVRIKVRLNATYMGKFYLPTVNCEAMYDNTIYARSKAQWVEVVSQDEQ